MHVLATPDITGSCWDQQAVRHNDCFKALAEQLNLFCFVGQTACRLISGVIFGISMLQGVGPSSGHCT